MVKNLPANADDKRDVDSILGLGLSLGEGNGNPVQCSCLENSMDRGAMGLQRIRHNWSNLEQQQQRTDYFEDKLNKSMENTPCVFLLILHVVIQSLNCIQLFVTLWTVACQAPLSSTISWSLLKLMSIESMMLSNHLIPCHPLFLLPLIFPSIRVFSNEFFFFF